MSEGGRDGGWEREYNRERESHKRGVEREGAGMGEGGGGRERDRQFAPQIFILDADPPAFCKIAS